MINVCVRTTTPTVQSLVRDGRGMVPTRTAARALTLAVDAWKYRDRRFFGRWTRVPKRLYFAGILARSRIDLFLFRLR